MRSTICARGGFVGGSGELGLERPDGGVEGAVGAAGGGELGGERVGGGGLAAQGAQDVEGDDVARAFPDRVQRRLAEEARHRGVLDVAGAAVALHAS